MGNVASKQGQSLYHRVCSWRGFQESPKSATGRVTLWEAKTINSSKNSPILWLCCLLRWGENIPGKWMARQRQACQTIHTLNEVPSAVGPGWLEAGWQTEVLLCIRSKVLINMMRWEFLISKSRCWELKWTKDCLLFKDKEKHHWFTIVFMQEKTKLILTE